MSDRQRAGRIPVPPLGEIGRQRIRQAVFARLDAEPELPAFGTPGATAAARPRRFLAAGLAGAVAAGLVLVAVAVLGDRGRSSGAEPVVSRVVTHETASRVAVEGAILDVAAGSSLTVSQGGGAVTIVLEDGAVDCQVAPRHGRPPFAVLAAEVRVEVVGTRFTVRRAGDDVGVSVVEGIVRVTRGADSALVPAGRTWSSPGSATASGDVPAPGAASEPITDEVALDMDPLRLRRPQPRSVAPDGAVAHGGETSAPAAPSAGERYEAAVQLENAGQAERAIAAYRALAAEGGTWGANALFAEARLERERGRSKQARRLLESYLERFPGGPNASLARSLLRDEK